MPVLTVAFECAVAGGFFTFAVVTFSGSPALASTSLLGAPGRQVKPNSRDTPAPAVQEANGLLAAGLPV